MRGKSPGCDVEMTKKLNFVAAILDIWRALLNQFWPFIHIFLSSVTHSKIVWLTRFFFLQVQEIPMKCFVLCVLSFSKSHEMKMTKIEFCGGNFLFWWPFWIDNGYFLSLYCLHDKHDLWFYHKVNDRQVFCTNGLH